MKRIECSIAGFLQNRRSHERLCRKCRLFIRKLQKPKSILSLSKIRISHDFGFQCRTSDPLNFPCLDEAKDVLHCLSFSADPRLSLIIEEPVQRTCVEIELHNRPPSQCSFTLPSARWLTRRNSHTMHPAANDTSAVHRKISTNPHSSACRCSCMYIAARAAG